MEALVELVDKWATLLGLQATRLWPQVILLYWVTTLGQAVVGVLLLCLSWIGSARAFRKSNEARRKWDEEPHNRFESCHAADAYLTIGVIAAVVWVITLIVVIVTAPGIIATLFAPEAAFIMEHIPRK